MITWQPQRRSATRSPAQPAAGRASPARSAVIRSVGAQPNARRGRALTRLQPLLQLGVEVARAGEAAAGQERALQIVVRPLDQALAPPGRRGLQTSTFAAEGAAERLALRGQLDPPAAPAPDRALAVPDQHPRHRPQPGDQLPPAGEQVRRRPGRDQQRRQPPGVAGDHRQHRQLGRPAGLPESDRQLDRREPQIALRDLARLHSWCARPGPAADTPGAARPPGR